MLGSSRYLPRRIQFRHVEDNVRGKHFQSVLDIGAGKAPYKKLVSCEKYEVADKDIANLDERLPFADNSFDLIICTQVFEYLHSPQFSMNELFRVTKPRGTILLSMPFAWRVHDEPFDLFRYSPYGMRYLCQNAGFKYVDVRGGSGNTYTMIALLVAHMKKPIYKPLVFILNVIARLFFDRKSGTFPLDVLGVVHK